MASPSFSERYLVAGRAWELATNSSLLIAAARNAFPDGIPDSSLPVALRLRLDVGDGHDRGPWERPICRGRDHFVFSRLSDQSSLVFDFHRHEVVGEVSQAVAADSDYWRTIVFPFALGVMSPVLDTVPLHAACFVHEGQGVLIGGRSGVGKSTLSATLARRGLTFVSDDWVYLARSPELRAYAMPVPMKLLPDAVTFFPGLRGLRPVAAENGEMSIPFDPAKVFGTSRAHSCAPHVVILLDRKAGSRLSVRRASGKDLREWFSESLDCVPDCLREQRSAQLALIDRLQSCACYFVQTDGTPDKIANDVLSVCARRVAPLPAIDGPDTSGIEHLDLLRRGVPACHTAIVEVGDDAAQLTTNSSALLSQFPISRSGATWSIAAIIDTSASCDATTRWQRDNVSFCSLGRESTIVCDAAHHEVIAFISPSSVASGVFAREVQSIIAARSLSAAGARQ